MAGTTFQLGGIDSNWSTEGNWTNGKPAAGFLDAVFDGSSPDCDLDENSAALDSLTMTDYTGELDLCNSTLDIDGHGAFGGTVSVSGTGDIEVSGNFTKTAGMTFQADIPVELNGTGSITTAGVSGGDVTVNTAGTHQQVDEALWEALELVLGTYDQNNQGVTLVGTFHINGGSYTDGGGTLTIGEHLGATAIGTLTATGLFKMNGGVNRYIAWPHSSKQIPSLEIAAGCTAVPTDTVWAKTTITGAGNIGNSAETVGIYPDCSDNFWTLAGTCGSNLEFYATANRTTGGAFNMANSADIIFRSAVDELSFTADGDITGVGTLHVFAHDDGNRVVLDMDEYALEATTVTPGRQGKGDGSIDFGSGAHTITNFARAHADNTANAADFATCTINMSGTMDGTGITFSNTTGRICNGGTLANIDCSGTNELYAVGCVDGGSNLNVMFTIAAGGAGCTAAANRRHLGGR